MAEQEQNCQIEITAECSRSRGPAVISDKKICHFVSHPSSV